MAMTVSAAEGDLVIDLAVDTSAVMERLFGASQPAVTAPTRTEILLVALDQELADASADSFLRFGRGRHASGLNFGDCFSYALAHRLKVPLLFVGNDFSQTDLAAAL